MDRLVKLAEDGAVDELEMAWMEAAEGEDVDWPDMLMAARIISRKKNGGLVESLVSYLAAALAGRGRCEEALKAVELACGFLPRSPGIRSEFVELYRKVHGEREWCVQALDSLLGSPSAGFPESIELLRKIERLSPGTYVRKDPGARIGRIEGFRAGEGLVVDIEGEDAVVPLERVDGLCPLDSGDIRALVLYEKERLAVLAEENPTELLRLVLNTFEGRTELGRIRRYLQAVVGESGWQSWWTRARREAEQAPDIGSTGGRNPQFFIRARHISRADELREAFDRAAESDRPALAIRIAGELGDEREEDRTLLHHIAAELMKTGRENAEAAPRLAIESLTVVRSLAEESEAIAECVGESPDWAASLDWARLLRDELCDSPYLAGMLEGLPGWIGDGWREIITEEFPCLPLKGCQIAFKLLGRGSDPAMEMQKAVETVLGRPDARLGALLWIWRLYVAEEQLRETVPGISGMVLLRRILSAAASAGRAQSGRSKSDAQALDALKDALTGEGEEAVEAVVRGEGDRETMALINLVERNPGLNDYTRKRVSRAVRAARPELFRVSRPPWESDAIYTTREGLDRRKQAYEEVVNVKMPRIIRQVGEAARFGDLSENAEYTAALEERDRLSRAADEMEKDISRARIIPTDMSGSDHVTIGSKVKALEHDSGATRELTFLGPWDADPAAGVYAYNSPLALAFMGAKVGDEVRYEAEKGLRRWKILSIEPAETLLR